MSDVVLLQDDAVHCGGLGFQYALAGLQLFACGTNVVMYTCA